VQKRLTRAVLEGLKLGECAYDVACPGFFAEAGAKSVALRVKADLRRPGKKATNIKATIGHWPALALDDARPLAMAWLAKVKSGVDPRAPEPTQVALTVAAAYSDYTKGAVKRRGVQAQRNCDLMKERLGRYCPDWLDRPLASIQPQEARDRHDQIMAAVKARGRIKGADGARSANQVLRDLRAVWTKAAKVWRDLPECPVDAVEWAPERNEHSIIEWSDLPAWNAATQLLSNPLRRTMHHVGLFSGLRPGNLVGMQRAWIDLDRRVVSFPASAMKGRRAFDLALSDALVRLLAEALVLSKTWFPGAPWVFPTRDVKGQVVPTRAWKERTMPGWTGHALRHTYSAAVILAGVSEVSRELLIAHKLPGIRGRYVDDRALWPALLADQEKVSRKILALFAGA
jgi:integrase